MLLNKKIYKIKITKCLSKIRAKIEEKEKIKKKWKLSKPTKYDFLKYKMTLSGIISTKTSKSPGKSGPHFDEH